MCAIAGIVSCDPLATTPHTVRKMLRAMAHRGPDNEQITAYQNATLGHRRLSIIDLHAHANQPMETRAGRYSITYNGEIYNYSEIRSRLSSDFTFRTNSDTEVLLRLLECRGTEALTELNGIYAFGLWDRTTRRLLLVRDPIGIKPIYWWKDQSSLIFSSELKGILASGLVQRDIEPEALHHLLSVQAVPPPLTMIKDVHVLPPGSYLIWEDGDIQIKRFFQLSFEEDDSLGDDIDAYIEKTNELVHQAILRQRRSDVDSMVALSGGIDSSVIAALLHKAGPRPVPTITLTNLEDRNGLATDEYHSQIVANFLKSDLTIKRLSNQDVIHNLPKAIWAQDQPSLRSFVAYLLFEVIPRTTRVVYYGTGGDELFAGYGTMQLLQNVMTKRTIAHIPIGYGEMLFKFFPSLHRYFPQANYTFKLLKADNIYRQRQVVDWIFLDDEKADLYSADLRRHCRTFSSEDYFRAYTGDHEDHPAKIHQQLDWLGIVCEHTTLLDAVSMAHGLEVRVPLLDIDVVNFAAHLPASVLAPSNRDNKYLLREAFRSLLPASIIDRPKQGFNISIEKYFSSVLPKLINTFLSAQAVKTRGLFSAAAIEQITNTYLANPHAQHRAFEKIFFFISIELWCRLFLDNLSLEEVMQSSEYFLYPQTKLSKKAAAK